MPKALQKEIRLQPQYLFCFEEEDGIAVLSLYASPGPTALQAEPHVFKTKHVPHTGPVMTGIVNILQDQRIYGKLRWTLLHEEVN